MCLLLWNSTVTTEHACGSLLDAPSQIAVPVLPTDRRWRMIYPSRACSGPGAPMDSNAHCVQAWHEPQRCRTLAVRKDWRLAQEKMSYDTFFTMKRLIERSRTVDDVLRWVAQNPSKVSYNHYPIALLKIGHLQQLASSEGSGAASEESPSATLFGQPDFQALCSSIVANCYKFDNFSIVNSLYAVAALGLPSETRVVQVLEDESRRRLTCFNQRDVSMVFSSAMRLHPASSHPLVEACLGRLERHIEKERHPQTLFLLLAYYRGRSHALQGSGPTDGAHTSEQLVAHRKILRLVKHTLANLRSVRDHEMALLDEMLSVCAREANNKSLEVIFSSQLFYQNRQERFISSVAEELPKKVDSLTPYTMALISKYLARHRLREPRLLDTIAAFLVARGDHLNIKVIQKLVFPFSRMNYRPSNQQEFFNKLESILEHKALNSPLATVNILMSMFQLGYFPSTVLSQVFSSPFISSIMNGPYGVIVRRYLSLLDAAVQLEFSDYSGPRLEERHKVRIFDHVPTADEVNRKYSYKGLVAEALRQLVGGECYRQDVFLPPGYSTDFLLLVSSTGAILPAVKDSLPASAHPECPTMTALATEFHALCPFGSDQSDLERPEVGLGRSVIEAFFSNMNSSIAASASFVPRSDARCTVCCQPGGYYFTMSNEPSTASAENSSLSSPSESLAPTPSTPGNSPDTSNSFHFPDGKITEGESNCSQQTSHSAYKLRPSKCELYQDLPSLESAEAHAGTYLAVSRVSSESQTVTCLPEPADTARCDHNRTGKAKAGKQIHRVLLSVNDKWHYCHNSDMLVGSRAMRDRHLGLLGYRIIQLPYMELETLNGIEEVKQYLHQKLRDLRF